MGSIFGKAKRGFGKALKPRGPGVIRPKPTDRYGQQMKPKAIRPGKKDGGMLKAVKPSQKGLSKLPKEVRNKMGYMKDGGKAKKFPDLTGDGKVTRADVLKGRGVFAAGGKVKDKGAFETESRRQKQKQRKRIKRIGESLRKISPLPLPKLNKKDK
tara:strand:+ start:228 stop:695 length:468 start_codon:yes stop_codon:yes gene_type:complete